ncbi:helicase associated domain protein [Ostertagia ostertagi]
MGGESKDHFDLKRLKCDDYGIPQDISKRYFVFAWQRSVQDHLAIFSFISLHGRFAFEYACQLSWILSMTLKISNGEGRSFRKESQRNLLQKESKRYCSFCVMWNQVLIIAGDTGCGKSTQVPQYLLQNGYAGIACTQPRRIACTALARRVAYETLNAYGSEVAYQIRFETTKSKRTKMLFLTEGLLLRQMENDSLLQQYNVPGRLFPIQLRYHPIKQYIPDNEKKSHKIDPEPYVRILELIDKQFPCTERGDALVFLNGVAEITTVAEAKGTLRRTQRGVGVSLCCQQSAEFPPYYISQFCSDVVAVLASRTALGQCLGKDCVFFCFIASTLSVDEQDKVFDVAPPNVNLIKHETGSGTQKLSEFWVSKASADQRKGRAGRTGPGICYRLYSEEQYNKMDDFTTSEINRVSLQEMALRMISLNLGLDPRTFPFIERPEEEKLNEALNILKFQGVLYPDRDNQLTALGSTIAKLPVDVAIAKMLVLGCVVDHVEVILTVAAGLSVQSPFTNRSYRELDVVQRREGLTNSMGDPFTLIEIFREWMLQKCTVGKARRWALENGIDEHRMYEISKLRFQYRQILEDAGLIERPDAHELGEDDSRQRRIDQGDKKKLLDMKREARNQEKTRKVLRADKHFDSILNDVEEEDLENEKDPMKADVKTVEFLLSYKQRDVEKIRRTHKLRRKDAEVIRIIIAAGLYPNYTFPDPLNKYQVRSSIEERSRSRIICGLMIFIFSMARKCLCILEWKPFTLIHPNSTMAQYHAETLEPHADSEGRSVRHKILFYGLLLETTKPYICNVLPLPALNLLLFAKKVICDDWKSVLVDEFVEMTFSRESHCKEILQITIQIRMELNRGKCLQRKLYGQDFSARVLTDLINRLAYQLCEGDIEISMKRMAHPSRNLEDVGFFTPDGEIELEMEDPVIDQSVKVETVEDEDGAESAEGMVRILFLSTRRTRRLQAGMFARSVTMLSKKERKPTYYELLQQRMREREAAVGDDQAQEKKPRLELISWE